MVRALADTEQCHLWLWVTNNFLPDGLRVMAAWGFTYKTNMAWGKVRNGKAQIGMGQYLRGSHELCLFGTIGKTRYPEKRNVPSLLLAERTAHSRKPDEAFDVFERVSAGPRVELFCREARLGWTAYGNETSGHDFTTEQGSLL